MIQRHIPIHPRPWQRKIQAFALALGLTSTYYIVFWTDWGKDNPVYRVRKTEGSLLTNTSFTRIAPLDAAKTQAES